MSTPTSPSASTARRGPDGLTLGLGGLVLLTAWPAALLALWLRRLLRTRQGLGALLALGGGLLFAALCLSPLKHHVTATRDAVRMAKAAGGIGAVLGLLLGALPPLWLWTLPLTPLLSMIWDSLRPRSLDEQQAQTVAQQQERRDLAVASARRRVARAVARSLPPRTIAPGVNTAAVLAAVITPAPLFFARERQRLLYLTPDIGAASLHMLFLGENGSGKTQSMLRVAASIAAVTDWDIVFVDPKHDHGLRDRFSALMAAADRPCRRFPEEPYHGWEGDAGALLSRIMAIPTYATDGAASYYTDLAEVYLRAVLATGEPLPTSFPELEARLDYERLVAASAADPVNFARVATISAADARSIRMRFAMMTPKLTAIRGDGWRLSETRAAYIGLPVMANERDSQCVAKFLLEDIKHYLAVRKPADRRTVFLIDEFGALGTESVIRLAEMARSLGGVVMLGTQTLAGLGTADQQARIVGNMSVVLHRMSDPVALTRLAGVQDALTKTTQYQGRAMGNRGTYRVEQVDTIPAQDVRTLPTGCAWIIARGAAAKVQMGLMPDVPPVPIIRRAALEPRRIDEPPAEPLRSPAADPAAVARSATPALARPAVAAAGEPPVTAPPAADAAAPAHTPIKQGGTDDPLQF